MFRTIQKKAAVSSSTGKYFITGTGIVGGQYEGGDGDSTAIATLGEPGK